MTVTAPRMKNLYDDWESVARTNVALLRMQAVENPSDPRLAAIVGELSVISPQFRRWWAARNVAHQDFGTKTIHHPQLGALTLDWDGYAWTGDPDQQLVMWTAEPGSPSHDKLRILASWIATPTQPALRTSALETRS